jgi:hypothetical protein
MIAEIGRQIQSLDFEGLFAAVRVMKVCSQTADCLSFPNIT